MSRWAAVLALVFIVGRGQGTSAESPILAPASERFADDAGPETPDFQRHVSPLLGRLGCNGRACHGSFQGQGGFRLSLFGYDFAADHAALTTGVGQEKAPRIDRRDPAASLIVAKPTMRRDHEGDRRFDEGSWQERLLLRWIEAGAKSASPVRRLLRLRVEPTELVLTRQDIFRLQVVAEWEDDTREDVTCLCRFQTNDDGIATVNDTGVVRAVGEGDTHVVVFYDNGVAALPVIVPLPGAGGAAPNAEPGAGQIDQLIAAKLHKLGLVPSSVCGDAEFLRRASLDITGTLPTPAEVERFLADHSAAKRSAKVDELLKTSAYAAWWANRLCDYTGNNPGRQPDGPIGQQQAFQWRAWLHRRIAENAPYDELVAGIVLATGRSAGQTYDDYAREMSSYLRKQDPGDFAARETLPYYWARRNLEKPEDKALAFAHSFLGVQLQCAQCHKHPYDRWTQTDFKHFAGFFNGVKLGVAPESRTAFERIASAAGQPADASKPAPVSQEAAARAEEGQVVAWRELYVDAAQVSRGDQRLLGDSVRVESGGDPRAVVMQWMRQPENRYFARAFVNRVWANYFHAGLIEPVDDLNLANPPSNGPLLDYLTEGFVSSKYDMRWLHREIATSLAYQRSWVPNTTNAGDRRNFSRTIPRRLHAEVLYDAWKQTVASDGDLVTVRGNLERRAIGELATRMAGVYSHRIFGQPERLVACDCERSNSPSLLQAIFVQNDPLMYARLNESGWLEEIGARLADGIADNDPVPGDLIRQAYLRTVSRPPTAAETDAAARYFDESESLGEGLKDLLWALLNSKEFLLNH